MTLEMPVLPGQGEQLSGPESDQSTGSAHTRQRLRSVCHVGSTFIFIYVLLTSELWSRLSENVRPHVLLPAGWVWPGLFPVDPHTALEVRVFRSNFKFLVTSRVFP